MPWGSRLDVKPEHTKPLGLPFRKTTELAAQLLREFQAPAPVNVIVLFDTYSLCRSVGQACRDQHFHFASTLKSPRRLFKHGWKLKAGRYGKNLCRRRRTAPLVSPRPQGSARYRFVDAGWLTVGTRGPLHVVFSRNGAARKILGLVTDAPALSAAGLIQTYEQRWAIEPWIKDAKPLLGLGHDQNRPYRAAVIHLPLVGLADALLTHLCLQEAGAQGQRTRQQAADFSTAAAPEQLRSLLWTDLLTDLKESRHNQPVIEELERLRVA
jgi:hypothetical protein